ncbi:MAG: flagellar hook protein FlgE [Parvularcula sp.]|jgi:flagellar hook protein FlgE|nr:flagellar hook protein FlgE [Parvularcula sp.]
MSIGSALQTGVNGLRAQATKLATLSDNIANSATVGYKRADTQFSSLVINNGSSTSYTAGGVTTTVRTEVSQAGTILASDTNTDLAIAGNGFFAVSTAATGGENALTRAGSFRVDDAGFLRNAAGYYLMGYDAGPNGPLAGGGVPSLTTFDGLEAINLAGIQGSASPTTEIVYSGNIPAQAPTGAVAPVEYQSSIQYFDDLGAAKQLTLRWVQDGVAPTTVDSNRWNLEVYDGNATTGTLITTLSDVDFTGAAAGISPGTPDYNGATSATPVGYAAAMAAATGTLSITVPGPAGPATQTIDIVLGAEGTLEGVTQFGGDFTPQTNTDGSSLGKLQNVEIGEDGTVSAIFDNGEVRAIYRIPLADVINPEGMTPIDGNAFQLSGTSGDLRLAFAGTNNIGSIQSNALEGANVDIAEELTTLIETQRAYSSNATVIQTADEMLEEVTRLGR